MIVTSKSKSVPRMPSPSSRLARPRRLQLQGGLRERVLGAAEHEAVGRADGIPGERHPLQQEPRAALHQVLVDVGAGVALVAVGDDELLRPLGFRGEAPLRPGREAGAAAAAHLGGLDLGQQRLAPERLERPPQAGPVVGVATPGEDRLGQDALPFGLRRGAGRPGDGAVEHPRPGVDDVAHPDRRRGVAEAQADGLRQRHRAVLGALAGGDPEPGAHLLDRGVAGGGEAGGPGADADVALATRRQQVVVEGGDAVHGRLRQPRQLGRPLAVGVGQFAVVVHRLLQHLEGRGRLDRVVTADQLDKIPGHLKIQGRPTGDACPICDVWLSITAVDR
jgi:hypothetical protein